MKNKRKIIVSSIVAVILIFSGCASKNRTTSNKKIEKVEDVDRESSSYINGDSDGCETAKGRYTKNHSEFKNNLNYHEGWFNGRQRCQIAIW